MNKQPKALSLAELLDSDGWPDAAAKLRRLHEVNQDLLETLQRISFAKADQLNHSIDIEIIQRCARLAKEAIAKATEEQE